jgi:hypothetical protein
MTRFTASLAAFLLASTAATAQGTQPGAQFLVLWDQDGDGTVTLEEAQAHRADMFAAFDADEDGQLSAAERDEMEAMRAQEQDRMRAEGAGMGPGKGMGQGKGSGAGKGPANGPGRGPMGMGWNDPAPMMLGLDGDGNGQISRAEFLAGTSAWFARRDRDGDGVITPADFGRGQAGAVAEGG